MKLETKVFQKKGRSRIVLIWCMFRGVHVGDCLRVFDDDTVFLLCTLFQVVVIYVEKIDFNLNIYKDISVYLI